MIINFVASENRRFSRLLMHTEGYYPNQIALACHTSKYHNIKLIQFTQLWPIRCSENTNFWNSSIDEVIFWMHISGLSSEWFPMIVNSAEELTNVTLNVTSDERWGCRNVAWIGGTTNAPLNDLFYYSINPELYFPNNSGMYKTVNKWN